MTAALGPQGNPRGGIRVPFKAEGRLGGPGAPTEAQEPPHSGPHGALVPQGPYGATFFWMQAGPQGLLALHGPLFPTFP